MRPTMSMLPLLAECQYAGRSDLNPPASRSSNEMLLGVEVHDAIERELIGTGDTFDVSEEARPYVDEWLSWWETEGRAELGADGWLAEQAFAYDPHADAARHFGRIKHRQYPKTTTSEIAGTADALRVDAAKGRAVVVDWKTGDDFAKLTADAEDNKQLRGYALAVSRAFGVSTVTVAVVRITPAGVRMTRSTLDVFDLASAANDLRRLVDAIPTAHPRAGMHCKRCRAVSVCPATVAATEALAPSEPPPEPASLVVTSDNALPLLVRLRAVQAACEQVDDALRSFAEANNGIDLGDGKRWGKVTTERSSIRLDGPEGAVAMTAIANAGMSSAVEHITKTSQEALKRAVAAQGFKGKEATAKVKAVIDELRAIGALRTTTVESFKEYTQKGEA